MVSPPVENESRSVLTLVVVGGASGVGKTTLLNSIPPAPRFNTGTLFKEAMALPNRDDVRKSDWSQYEDAVAESLANQIVASFADSRVAVIDTHFGAKLNGRQYRIGLSKPLIFAVGTKVFSHALQTGTKMSTHVILINCNLHSLLRRRRLDRSRDRELVAADCFNALRENRMYSTQYHLELLRANQKACACDKVNYLVVENEDMEGAAAVMRQALRGL